MDSDGRDERLRTEKGYEMMVIESLSLTDQLSGEHGEVEGVIESLWASIPTQKKIDTDVHTADLEEMRPAILEWQRADEIRPRSEIAPKDHPKHRERIYRKKQVLVDTLAKMGILYHETPGSVMILPKDG